MIIINTMKISFLTLVRKNLNPFFTSIHETSLNNIIYVVLCYTLNIKKANMSNISTDRQTQIKNIFHTYQKYSYDMFISLFRIFKKNKET